MKTFDQFLFEKNATYSHGCVMLDVKPENNIHTKLTVPFIKVLQQQIPDEDLYIDSTNPDKFGKETEYHATILYGLHSEVTQEDVDIYAKDWAPIDILLTGISIFENPEKGFDVVKLDIESEDLKRYNKDLRNLPHTNDYPDYHAHLTLAYVKIGKGSKYTLKFDEPLKLEGLSDITYSFADKTKEKVKIKLAFKADLQ